MTICIAAIGQENGNECIVFATDRLYSRPINEYASLEFEQSTPKYKTVNKDIVTMISGDIFLFDALLKGTSEKQYSTVKEKIQGNFKYFRNDRLQEILNLFSIKTEDLVSLLYADLKNDFAKQILNEVTKCQTDSIILLAGFDEEKAMITTIDETMTRECRDISFFAIGNGQDIAIDTLFFQQHNKQDSLSATIYDVYKAKKNSEVRNGVGKNTDLVVLRKDEGCKKVEDEDLKILDNIYEEEFVFGRKHGNLSKLKAV